MDITDDAKNKLEEIGRKHDLSFIILHGSFAKENTRPGSDLDIAVLGKHKLTFQEVLEIHGELGDVFGDNEERELDLKSLHGADLLLRYYITRDGLLLYGDRTDFNELKTYARHAFEDARKLFGLERILLKKQNRLMREQFKHA